MNAVYALTAERKQAMLTDEEIFASIPKAGAKKLLFDTLFMKRRAAEAGVDAVNISEIGGIMESLGKAGYFDMVIAYKKDVPYYVIELLNPGQTFEREQRDKKRMFRLILLRTVLLAILSFVITLILKKSCGM